MAKKPNPKVTSKKHLARLERERIQNRNIILVSAVVILLVVGLIGYGVLNQSVLQYLRPVAKVGNTSIVAKDFIGQASLQRIQLVSQYQQEQQMAQFFGNDPTFQQNLSTIESQLSDPNTLGSTVLDQMIDNVLIREEAAKRGITVSTAEIDKAVYGAFGYYANGTPTPTITPTVVNTPTISSTEKFLIATMIPSLTSIPSVTPTLAKTLTPTITLTPTLSPTITPVPPTDTPTSAVPSPTDTPAPTDTPYTQKGYQTQVSSYLSSVKQFNISEADVRELITNGLYRQKVSDAITASLKPSQDQVWARHILVADLPTAQKVEAELKIGSDWTALAAKYSTDTSNKDTGGDLGWFGRGTMVAEFENVAFSMGIGSISQPVKSQFGYHIIQVLGHEVRPLTDTEFTTLKQTTFTNWLTKTRGDRKDIVKYDNVWQSIVPLVPTLPPTQVAAPPVLDTPTP